MHLLQCNGRQVDGDPQPPRNAISHIGDHQASAEDFLGGNNTNEEAHSQETHPGQKPGVREEGRRKADFFGVVMAVILQPLLRRNIVDTRLSTQVVSQAYYGIGSDDPRDMAFRVLQVAESPGSNRADIYACWSGIPIDARLKPAFQAIIDAVDTESAFFNHAAGTARTSAIPQVGIYSFLSSRASQLNFRAS